MTILSLPYRWVENLVALREKRAFSIHVVLAFATFVGFGRIMLEFMVCSPGMGSSLAGYLSYVTFYFMNAFLYTATAAALAGVPWKKGINVVLIGVFVGIFPPLLDTILVGIHEFRYVYNNEWLAGWRWWIYNPERHIPPGEAITLWFTIILLPLYVWIRTRSLARAAAALVAGYGVCFFYVTVVASASRDLLKLAFVPAMRPTELNLIATLEASREGVTNPAVLQEISRRVHLVRVDYNALAIALTTAIQVAVALFCHMALERRLTRHLAVRVNHSLPFAFLALLGAATTRQFLPGADAGNWTGLAPAGFIALVVLHLFNTAIVQNDYYDRDADRRGSVSFLGIEEVRFYDITAWMLIATALSVRPRVGALLCLFQIVSTLYNHDFYRGKKHFPANYKIEGVWGWTAFMAGAYAVLHPRQQVPDVVLVMGFLVFGGWSIFNAFKDYKDIREDYRARVQTAYVLLKRRGKSLRAFHLGLRITMTCGFLVPQAFLLSWGTPAVVVAGITATTTLPVFIALGGPPKKATVETVLALVSLYILELVWVFEAVI